MENIVTDNFFDRVLDILKNARKQAKTALKISMDYSYYEVGRMIVEEEQNGEQRAEYGKAILKELSKRIPAKTVIEQTKKQQKQEEKSEGKEAIEQKNKNDDRERA